jgi:ferric-dicitrate binding protein FerR (iron transport regulator)
MTSTLRSTQGRSPAACPRRWEAEAIEDGRLLGADRASFERHLPTCADCRAEVAALEEIRALLAHAPRPTRTPLQRRAERAAILQRGNERYVGARASRPLRLALAFAAATVVLASGLAFSRAVATRPLAPAVAALGSAIERRAPRFEVLASQRADYQTTYDGNLARVTLRAGVATFRVERLAPQQRFVLTLPDGEIEVRGTRFEVAVEEGQTRAVEVLEGSIELRLGAERRSLLAGQRWQSRGAAVAAWSSGAPAPSDSAVAPSPSASAGPTATGSASVAPPSPGARYAKAIEAYRAGRFAEADAELAAHLRSFPGDPSAEDATFLRAVCHDRLGDRAGAATLAKAYLARYPGGLRAPEAEKLAAGGGE